MPMTDTHPVRGVSAGTVPGQSRLFLDGAALCANWRALDRLSGAASCAAAVKADGYGLGAREVVRRLGAAGCRDFFVAHWPEAAAISDLVDPAHISVLHGVQGQELNFARALGVKPVINSVHQARQWIATGGGLCDLMVDTGMARLGIAANELGDDSIGALDIDIVMSHLASADEDSTQNRQQCDQFTQLSKGVKARRRSLANSAGIALGRDYHFDVTRPGLSVYGGIARAELTASIAPVVTISARVLQVRDLQAGDPVGYGATFVAPGTMRAATLGLGYADGYLRGFSGKGLGRWQGAELPVLGRVSMDLLIVDATAAKGLAEEDWVAIDYDLVHAERISGLSQYELLTGLGNRFERVWRD